MKPNKSFIIGAATLLALAYSTLPQDGEVQRQQLVERLQPAMPVSSTGGGGGGGGGQSSGTTVSSAVAYDDRTGTAVVHTKGPASTVDRLARIVAPGRAEMGRALIIPKDDADAKNVGDLEEDLGVMAHILDKAVSSDADKATRAMGIVVNAKPFASGARNLYIDGYGAIFFFGVNFPLLPPPAKETVAKEKESTSNEWEQARREIEQPQAAREPWGNAVANYNTFTSAFGPGAGGRAVEY